MTLINDLLINALQKRQKDTSILPFTNAYRLFNGVFEGDPTFSIDIYNNAAVIHSYQQIIEPPKIEAIVSFIKLNLANITFALLKQRNSKKPEERMGTRLFGNQPVVEIKENGVYYAIDLTMNQDCGIYLDTANLRRWLKANSQGKSVLNTFSYTGSLGIAALAGNAMNVIQQDKNKAYMRFSRLSSQLNGFDPGRLTHHINDFFPAMAGYRKQKAEFDIVILDPPIISNTGKGKVELEGNYLSLINKIRPLVADQGTLILVNNALFLSGNAMLDQLTPVLKDKYIKIKQIVPVPESYTGYHPDPVSILPADPTPFNHSTKILFLQVTKK